MILLNIEAYNQNSLSEVSNQISDILVELLSIFFFHTTSNEAH